MPVCFLVDRRLYASLPTVIPRALIPRLDAVSESVWLSVCCEEDADALGVMVYGSGKEDKAAVEKAQRDWSELGERVKALKMEGEKEKAFEEALEKNAEALRGVLSVLWSVCWISVVDGDYFFNEIMDWITCRFINNNHHLCQQSHSS